MGNRRCDPVCAAPPAARAVHAAPPQPRGAHHRGDHRGDRHSAVTMLTASLLQEASGVYERIQTGELSVGRYFARILDALPYLGGQFAGSLWADKLPRRPRESVGRSDEEQPVFASQAINIGQNTFAFVVGFFVMLYLLFFLLRDGAALLGRIRDAMPLRPESVKLELAEQVHHRHPRHGEGQRRRRHRPGRTGEASIFRSAGDQRPAVLWAVLMAFLSLLPAVGAALARLPAAMYLLATGATCRRASCSLAYGVLVIGLVQNPRCAPSSSARTRRCPTTSSSSRRWAAWWIFGINGFVIGPVIAAMFIAVWGTFSSSRPGQNSEGP